MIRVGTAGWSYPDWEGIVYPRPKPRGFHPLAYLARYVDCVEVNSTFYGVPRPDAARGWLARVAERPDFRFAVKLFQGFTHEELPESDAELEAAAEPFHAAVAPLADAGRLLAVLVQLPHSFPRTDAGLRRLERIEGCFGHLPLVVELRHRSWFEREPLERVGRLGYSLAWIDLPAARDHPPAEPPTIGPLGYLRLHGRNAAAWFARGAGRDRRYDWLYAEDEVAEIAARVGRLASGVDETAVITNNHFSGKAVANALELLAALGRGRPAAPPGLVTAYPRLERVVRPDAEETLFG